MNTMTLRASVAHATQSDRVDTVRVCIRPKFRLSLTRLLLVTVLLFGKRPPSSFMAAEAVNRPRPCGLRQGRWPAPAGAATEAPTCEAIKEQAECPVDIRRCLEPGLIKGEGVVIWGHSPANNPQLPATDKGIAVNHVLSTPSL